MQRITNSDCFEALRAAILDIPKPTRRLLAGTHVLGGVDPVFVGLHRHTGTGDGRLYCETAHVCYGGVHCDGETTVVLPTRAEAVPWIVVHEFGHVLHERLGWPVAPEPVTAYAEADEWEAFAEAFTASVVPGYAPWPVSRQRLADYLLRWPHLRPYFVEGGSS